MNWPPMAARCRPNCWIDRSSGGNQTGELQEKHHGNRQSDRSDFSSSTAGFEDAVSSGIAKAAETVDNIEGAWVKDTKVVVDNGRITEWRVILAITFLVH